MAESEIETVLTTCEQKLAAGESINLGAEGFWRTVGRVKRDPTLIERYAERIGQIDRRAFEAWALRSYPIRLGEALLWLGTIISLAVVAVGYYIDEPWNGLLLLAGTGGLMVTTHGLGHLIIGRLVGMRFTHWFIPDLAKPQPGVKTDYASYLRTPARRRAWMHASGALTTKAMPFLMLGAAAGMSAPLWSWIALIGIGVVTIITDITMSTKNSDWKKFNREMAIARQLEESR